MTRRAWCDRWWLLLANLLVVNAVSLHVGPGGLRTPSPAVNLWITALVLSAPLLRSRFRALPRPEWTALTRAAMLAIDLFGTAVLACFAGSLLGLLVLFGVVGLRRVPVEPAFWLWCLVSLLPWLLVDALRASARPVRFAFAVAAVRALACVPPCCLLAVVLLLVPVDARAWVGGVDSMFEPVARIDRGAQSLVAVRSDPMAFTRPTLRILTATPVVPGVLGWWRELGSLYDVATADLHLDGEELCVEYRRNRTDLAEPAQQRRFRVR